MPDLDRADQILALGRVLSRIPTGNAAKPYMNTPPPLIGLWATELVDKYGVRVHADLATEELVRVSSPGGNHAPVQSVTRNTPAPLVDTVEVTRMQSAHDALMSWLAQHDPEMHRRVQNAKGDPMATALVLAEIHRDHPEVVAKGEELLRNTSVADQ